jgi:hypothetical protein
MKKLRLQPSAPLLSVMKRRFLSGAKYPGNSSAGKVNSQRTCLVMLLGVCCIQAWSQSRM